MTSFPGLPGEVLRTFVWRALYFLFYLATVIFCDGLTKDIMPFTQEKRFGENLSSMIQIDEARLVLFCLCDQYGWRPQDPPENIVGIATNGMARKTVILTNANHTFRQRRKDFLYTFGRNSTGAENHTKK